MAYVPTNPGWGAAASLAKKKLPPPPGRPNKPVGSFDPYRSTDINSVVDYLTRLQAGGPEYGKYVTEGPSSDALQQEALTQSAWQLMPAQLQYERQQMQSTAGRNTSQQAATAFTQALSGILQGGKTGDEGMAYAKENYGGSYLGVIAAQMGSDLFKQITHDFDQQDFELADKIGTAMAQQPEIMQRVYDGLVAAEEGRIKGQAQDAETDYKNRVQALGFRIGQLRKNQDALAKATAAIGKDNEGRVIQTSDRTYSVLPDGTVLWEIKNPPKPPTAKAPTTRRAPDGTMIQWDPAQNSWVPSPGAPAPTPSSTGKGMSAKDRTKLFYDTRSAARGAARELFASGTIGGSTSDSMPGTAPGPGSSSLSWNDAYNTLWGEYGVALVGRRFGQAKVRQMILRALRDAGFRKPAAPSAGVPAYPGRT